MRPNKRNLLVTESRLDLARSVRNQVSQITNMSFLVGRTGVGVVIGVVVTASRDAAICVIAKLVDMETVVAGSQPNEFDGDGGGARGVALGILHEFDSAFHGRISLEDSDSSNRHFMI